MTRSASRLGLVPDQRVYSCRVIPSLTDRSDVSNNHNCSTCRTIAIVRHGELGSRVGLCSHLSGLRRRRCVSHVCARQIRGSLRYEQGCCSSRGNSFAATLATDLRSMGWHGQV